MKKTIIPLAYITDGKKIIAVICLQWGDTGKGKIVYLFTSWADIVFRGNGGPNAGHTLIYKGQEFVCHLLPSGILNPKVVNVISKGVALDLPALAKEMSACPYLGFENLFIAHETNLLMPYHVLEDLTCPESKLIGTTGCGIGPFYADARLAISINDLANEDIFLGKLNKFLDVKQEKFGHLNRVLVKDIMFGKKYGGKFNFGDFYDHDAIFNREAIINYYLGVLAPQFTPKLINLSSFVAEAKAKGKNILLEGAQGTLLSVDYGTTFYQTSSDSSIEGLAKGCGFKVSDVDLVLGITKAPYMTRVGNGPFPSEYDRINSEVYCRDSRNNAESEKNLIIDMNEALNSRNEMIQGLAIRLKGKEYGATTGRARRPGRLDLPALKHSIKINGPNLVLTKFDVMTGLKTIELCIAYIYCGPRLVYGDKIINDGDKITEFIRDSEILYRCKPIYKEFPGWKVDISKMRTFSELPKEVKKILSFIEKFTGGNILILSVGPGSEETIILNGELKKFNEKTKK